MKEIWKDIKGYKGLYQASNHGRFKNLRNGKFLSPTFSDDRHDGNLGLRNRRDIWKTFKPSRIIAELFIPNPHNYETVKCKGDNKNMNPSNWYWKSWSEVAEDRAKSRTITIHNFICQNKDCKKVFTRATVSRKYKYCSKKCSKQYISKKTRKLISNCRSKKVMAIKADDKIIFNSIAKAGDYIDRNPSAISNVLAGRQKSCSGYKFKFINDK